MAFNVRCPPALLSVLAALCAAVASGSMQTRSQVVLATASSSGVAPATESSWVPTFRAPQLTPTQFLIISSPTQKKVVYTRLKNFKSATGRTFALIDSGLEEPCGISMDRDRGHLYVADRGAKAIYRYSILVQQAEDDDGNSQTSLVTDGNRLTILSGRSVEWVAINHNGDVFYSDQVSNSINKITADVMQRLQVGMAGFSAEDLTVVSEKQQEATAAASRASQMLGVSASDPKTSPHILSIYESPLNPHVTVPAGIVSDGIRLYWANQASGKTAGAAVQGEVNPKAPPNMAPGSEPAAFPSLALTNITEAAYGIAKSSSCVFISSQDVNSPVGGGIVYGMAQTGGDVYNFATNLGTPRGLVWDGDQTIFVADEGANTVSSFPAGRLMNNAPLSKTVEFAGAYGVAILAATDTAFSHKAAAFGARPLWSGTVGLLLLLAASLSFGS
mmetsp:Transcript_72893/g.158215  ORF Transcript_72893/g.158215 Transcript_72893/m.158215 type:complete len:446 (-) Transcript_72893:56-1393(-)